MVRSKLTVIPQEPVLFPGTTRENITAFKSLDDDMVLRALEKVKAKRACDGTWWSGREDGRSPTVCGTAAAHLPGTGHHH